MRHPAELHWDQRRRALQHIDLGLEGDHVIDRAAFLEGKDAQAAAREVVQLCLVARAVLRPFAHGVVKCGANIARLKIDNVDLGICQFELHRHRESSHSRLGRVVSRHEWNG